MRNLPIAYGNSCFAKKWSNKTITFEVLCLRLKTTIRTVETQEEYPKLKKYEKDRVKDKGGFVGGLLKDNRRKRENIVSRSMLTLDADNASIDLISNFESLCNYSACLYTTHSHVPQSPRCRIIIPLTRDVTADEYTAISRYFTHNWGIDMFDECSYRPHQLMYWPTTSSNGEYIFKEVNKNWLNPDLFLAAFPNWRDCTLLPTSSRESSVYRPSNRKQEDPLEKKGIVGAFCRAYTVESAIQKFIPSIYAPSLIEGRYDYIPAESSAGVVIYDGKFAYSHHASDPACGKLLNAFDLVRIHTYGHLDKNDEKPITQRPSNIEMTNLAISDEKVKGIITKEKIKKAGIDFDDTQDWNKNLEVDKRCNILDSLENIVLILRNDSNLKNIKFNLLSNSIEVIGSVPWEQTKPGWSDVDISHLKIYISNVYKIYSPNKFKDALTAVADERAFHPIKNYFNFLPKWDGIDRVETLFIDYLGAEDSTYVRDVTRKTMIAAVARIYEPGIKFDSVPILNGPQGIGKSTFFSKLSVNWFSDSLTLTDMKDKAGPEKLQGYWILELGELAGMRKADIETVKSFISRNDDKSRASYGVNVESHPRQCIVVGTTNAEEGFLRDITGNRRFWPIKVTGDCKKKPWYLTNDVISQIWAEALVFYYVGENLFLEGEAAILAQSYQGEALETDEREGLIKTYLDTLIPTAWDEFDLGQRRDYLSGFNNGGGVVRDKVCNLEIWSECLGKNPSDLKKMDSYEIASIMKKLDSWVKKDRTNFHIYGRQRFYERINSEKC